MNASTELGPSYLDESNKSSEFLSAPMSISSAKRIIAETKAAYLAKSKEAKAKVNEIKKQYKDAYLAHVKEINENAAKYDAELSRPPCEGGN